MYTVACSRVDLLIKGKLMTTPSFHHPDTGRACTTVLHYSRAMRIGDRVEISGQGGWNDDLVIPESIEEEIEQAFKNVERTLATAGTLAACGPRQTPITSVDSLP
jgi:enamine deaminase RidA (YjgF/YER057c/UK114 family)